MNYPYGLQPSVNPPSPNPQAFAASSWYPPPPLEVPPSYPQLGVYGPPPSSPALKQEYLAPFSSGKHLQVPGTSHRHHHRSLSDSSAKKHKTPRASPKVKFDLPSQSSTTNFSAFQTQPLPPSPVPAYSNLPPGGQQQPNFSAFQTRPFSAPPSPYPGAQQLAQQTQFAPFNGPSQPIPLVVGGGAMGGTGMGMGGGFMQQQLQQQQLSFNTLLQQQPNDPFMPTQPQTALGTLLASKSAINRGPVDITNPLAFHQNAARKVKRKQKKVKEFTGYKFNPAAFETSFHKTKVLNYLQIITHQVNSEAPINEYLLLRPFSENFVSPSGLKIEVTYFEDTEEDQHYNLVYTDKVDPSLATDYVGVRNVGVVTDESLFFTIVNFMPLPMAGGRTRKPGKGEPLVPLETVRGWSSLIIMEARRRKILY